MSLGLTPTEGKVIIKPEVEEEVSKSGIVIARNEGKKKRTGKVAAVDALNELGLAVGDRVIYEEYGPHPIKFDGQEYVVIDTFNTQILAVISDDTEVNVHGEE